MVSFEQADEKQRDLITLLISGDTMSKDQQQKVREWLESRTGKASFGKPGK